MLLLLARDLLHRFGVVADSGEIPEPTVKVWKGEANTRWCEQTTEVQCGALYV